MKNILKYLFIILFLTSIVFDGSAATRAKKGELDLRNWDGKDIITLDGEWNFYWQFFLTDSLKNENIHSGLMVDVPSYWTEYYVDSLQLPGKGYGTYSLTVWLPNQFLDRNLALDIPIFDDSYTLFLNNERLAWNGLAGVNSEQAEPGYKPTLVIFQPKSEKLEIVIHVSNYEHRRGGFWKSIRIGESEKVIHKKKSYELIVHLTIGLIISSILFFSFFFIFNTKNKAALFFSLTMFGILLRIISTDTFAIQIFSNPSWEWIVRFEYLGTYIAFIFASWYFHNLYYNRITKIILLLNTVLVGLFCLFVIVLEPAYFSYTMYYFKPAVLVFFGFYLTSSFVHIFKRNEADEFYFAALLVFIIALINDIRVSGSASGFLNDYTIHFALQVFIFTHVVLMIHLWLKAFKEKEKLNFEVEFLNLKLEERIKDSVKESDAIKKEIQDRGNEILLIRNELETEKKYNSKMHSVLSEDLRSPITSLFQVSNYLSMSYGDGELRETIGSIRDLSSSASALLENLLFWVRCQKGEIYCTPQAVKIQDLLNETLSLNRVALKQKSIYTEVLIADNLEAFCDPHLIKIVLGNLVSNALKFSNKNGKISLTATHIKGEIILIIEDIGIGIPAEMLNVLNGSHHTENFEIRKGTHNEKGSGLGIRLSQELLKINKGKMKIESTIKKGTRVMVYLPNV